MINLQEYNTFPQIFIGDHKIGGFADLNNCSIFKPYYDYDKLYDAKVITANLNKVIDVNSTPLKRRKIKYEASSNWIRGSRISRYLRVNECSIPFQGSKDY